jgi:hypothetical protein
LEELERQSDCRARSIQSDVYAATAFFLVEQQDVNADS